MSSLAITTKTTAITTMAAKSNEKERKNEKEEGTKFLFLLKFSPQREVSIRMEKESSVLRIDVFQRDQMNN